MEVGVGADPHGFPPTQPTSGAVRLGANDGTLPLPSRSNELGGAAKWPTTDGLAGDLSCVDALPRSSLRRSTGEARRLLRILQRLPPAGSSPSWGSTRWSLGDGRCGGDRGLESTIWRPTSASTPQSEPTRIALGRRSTAAVSDRYLRRSTRRSRAPPSRARERWSGCGPTRSRRSPGSSSVASRWPRSCRSSQDYRRSSYASRQRHMGRAGWPRAERSQGAAWS